MPELELAYAAHTVLPDGSTLLAVLETKKDRSWLGARETSSTESYVFKAGRWWGRAGLVPLGPVHLRLCTIAMEQSVRAAVDQAIE